LVHDIVTGWSRRKSADPWVSLLLSLLCLFFTLIYSRLPPLLQHAVVETAGAIPSRTAAILAAAPSEWLNDGLLTVLTAIFLHSSWLHLVGNLAYLWVFGMPLERQPGALFLAFTFVAGGSLANIMVALLSPDIDLPVIGASGAVSAVVGAHLGLFPYRRIGLYLPLGIYLQAARVPALLVIGSWFTLQLVYTLYGPITGTVALWTHLAGFTLGLIAAMMARAFSFVGH